MQQLSEDFTVRAQITPDELADLKAQGFASVFCHRPDGEEAGQPEFAALKAAGEALGLEMHHHGVVPGQITDADVAAFGGLYEAAPKPIIAYCKTGGRAKMLWERMQAESGTT